METQRKKTGSDTEQDKQVSMREGRDPYSAFTVFSFNAV